MSRLRPIRTALAGALLLVTPLLSAVSTGPAGAASKPTKFCSELQVLMSESKHTPPPAYTSKAWHSQAHVILATDHKIAALAPTKAVKSLMLYGVYTITMLESAHSQAQWDKDLQYLGKIQNSAAFATTVKQATHTMNSCSS